VTCRCIAENFSLLQSHGEGLPGVTVLAFEKHLPWLLPSAGVGLVDTVHHIHHVFVLAVNTNCVHII
jgi:hypothetical protein